jgi:hypothetical protein
LAIDDQAAAITLGNRGELAGMANGNSFELARRIAEAQIDVQRVRQARHQFFADRLKDLGNASSPKSASSPNSTSLDPHTFAAILMQHSKEIKAISRYERRALSRRKFAIRALDVDRPTWNLFLPSNDFWQNEANYFNEIKAIFVGWLVGTSRDHWLGACR